MMLDQAQIAYAAKLIACIDSGESGLFLEKVNSEQQVDAKVFYDTRMVGVFFCIKNGEKLRIHIAFEENIDTFNDEIALLIQSSMEKTSTASCAVWVRNENRKVIEYLKSKFRTIPDGANDYASIEFIMRRERFNKPTDNGTLDIRPYEESCIDDYLCMLDGSMTFIDPHPNFRGNKEHFLRHFAECKQRNSFEAFWKENELIGL